MTQDPKCQAFSEAVIQPVRRGSCPRVAEPALILIGPRSLLFGCVQGAPLATSWCVRGSDGGLKSFSFSLRLFRMGKASSGIHQGPRVTDLHLQHVVPTSQAKTPAWAPAITPSWKATVTGAPHPYPVAI